jgi:hypothetical protein
MFGETRRKAHFAVKARRFDGGPFIFVGRTLLAGVRPRVGYLILIPGTAPLSGDSR